MREAVSRWAHRQVWGFPVTDLALAGAFCLIAVASVVTGNPDEGPLALTLPVAIVTCAALAWRVRSGIIAVALIIVASAVQTVLAQTPGSLWSLVVYAIVMYSVAAYYPEGVAALTGAPLVAALLVEERIADGVDYLFIVLLFGGLWLLGRASRYWRGRVTQAERRQQDAARLAVAEERVRIARDLHDVVAHSLSVIAVQSDAAEAALARDPERAREPVTAIRTTARSALHEIRDLLDVLRADDAGQPGVASPGIGAIHRLVTDARTAGIPVDYVTSLTEAPVTPAVDLVAYRVVQESLTNVLKHAGGAATTVTLEQDAAALRITVTDAGSSPQNTAVEPGQFGARVGGDGATADREGGYGILGIAERVRSVGGRLTTGVTPGGGYRVDVRIPLRTGRTRKASS